MSLDNEGAGNAVFLENRQIGISGRNTNFAKQMAVRSDGTVKAGGDNSYGRCNVQNWNEIVSVAAGTGHSVGLRADGTVVAAGNNNYQQCNVSSWSGIKSIGCGVYHTLGILEDGTVIAVGDNSKGQ